MGGGGGGGVERVQEPPSLAFLQKLNKINLHWHKAHKSNSTVIIL